jgi:hypothetical protein
MPHGPFDRHTDGPGNTIHAADVNELQVALEDTAPIDEVRLKVDDLAVRTDDYASIALAAAAAGWNTSDGGSVVRTPKGLLIPEGDHILTAPIAVYDTWEAHIRGEKGTVLAPGANIAALLRMDDCAYSLVERLAFASGTANTVDDVVRLDGPASAQGVKVRDLLIDAFDWTNALSLGLYSSNNDFANVVAENIEIVGDWTAGNTTTCQQGVTFGAVGFGNTLNLTLQNSSIGGTRYPLVITGTNVTIRDVHIDTGQTAIKGITWGYFVWDGFRVEDCQMFADFSDFSTAPAPKVFRNGWYAHNLTTTSNAANFGQAGDILFENVFWRAVNYPTTKARIGGHASFKPRTITFRNFMARETPEELYWDQGADDWKYNWWIFDGYHRIDADTQPITSIHGLYTRSLSANANLEPYDGIMKVSASGAARTITLPPAANHIGREVVVIKTDSSANTVTINGDGSETVGGSLTLVLSTANERVHIVSNGTGWEAKSRTAIPYDVRNFGAVLDGVTDDLPAVQAAVDAAIAAGEGTVWIEGTCAINGAIQFAGATLVYVGLKGRRTGTKIIQLADNTPIININVTTQMHSCEFGGFQATWNPTETAADTAAVLFHLDHTTGDVYNNTFGDITLTNGYRFIDTDGQLFWGNEIHNVMATNLYGGFYELNAAAGQPNNMMRGVYLGAQDCTATLFLGNALTMTYINCEINQVTNGVKVLQDPGGGDHRFLGEFSVEGGAWATASQPIFEVQDTRLTFDTLKIEGTCTQLTRLFHTEGSGRIKVLSALRLGIVPSGSGHLYVWQAGGTLTDPTTHTDRHVVINEVTFYGSLAGWTRTTNWVTPTDMGSSGGADSGVILAWMRPGRMDYAGNAAYTLIPGGPNKVVFNTTLTANRDFTLSHTDFLFSGYSVIVVKNVTGGDVVVKSSGGSTIVTLAAANRQWVEVTFNRSIGDGPSIGWSITGGGTLP